MLTINSSAHAFARTAVWYFRRCVERSTMWIAWHLPRYLVMWCAIRVAAHATTGKYGYQIVPELTAMDALQRWDDVGGIE